MPTLIKMIWVFAIVVNGVSLVWFLLGTTANFQRSMDLIGTAILLMRWVPSFALFLISIRLLIKGWVPTNYSYVVLGIMIVALLILAVSLFGAVETRGWLYDDIYSDPMQVTSDGKYKYRTQLINPYQNNRSERLHLMNVSTGEEIYISVEIFENSLSVIPRGSNVNWAWGILSSTDVQEHYELTTTETLRVPQKRFLIDVGAGTSKRLE